MTEFNLHNIVKEKYIQFLNQIRECEEDETKNYDIQNFIETQSDNINFIELFIQNFFLHTQEILEQNIDFFATQKKYVLITKKGKQMKKRNPRRSYIFGREDEQLFYQYLIKNKKIQYKNAGLYMQSLTDILNSLLIKDDNKYVFHQDFLDIISMNNNYEKYQVIIDNIDSIMKTFEDNDNESDIEEESVDEVESLDEEENLDEDVNNSTEIPNIPGMPNIDFLKNSKIGKLAEKISKNINVEDLNAENPADLMKSLFNGEGGNGGLQNLIGQVFSQVQETMSDENSDFNENDLANEAQGFLKNMGGLGGLGGGKDGNPLGNIAEIFGNMQDFDNGDSIPKYQKKSTKKSSKKSTKKSSNK